MDGKAVGIFLLATVPFLGNVNSILHMVSVGDGTSGAERQARKKVPVNPSQPQIFNHVGKRSLVPRRRAPYRLFTNQ
jgi:hypothetical protein